MKRLKFMRSEMESISGVNIAPSFTGDIEAVLALPDQLLLTTSPVHD
ncbi:MAG: hypothetical protein GDA56_04910 [Hormoscilla sp. GM7CHS1pb]|nr:hypothetical protein [Hormoscilla sp. GM7CHS1pb]